MRNSLLDNWIEDSDYFSALAVLSNGALHPGGLLPNEILAARLPWDGVPVLDIGAGTGLSHRFFKALGARVISVEPNEWMRRAAVRAGVNPSEIYAAAAEEITPSWLAENLKEARLLVQGVSGFISTGLQALESIMSHPSITEIVIVEWVGARADVGLAPMRHCYSSSEFLASVEKAGFQSIWLETFTYPAPGNRLDDQEAVRRVEWHFPEAQELDWIEHLPRKLSTIALPPVVSKDYIVLIAKRSHQPKL